MRNNLKVHSTRYDVSGIFYIIICILEYSYKLINRKHILKETELFLYVDTETCVVFKQNAQAYEKAAMCFSTLLDKDQICNVVWKLKKASVFVLIMETS